MKLIVNGSESGFDAGLTIADLLSRQDVAMPEMVSVELNGRILKRSEFDATTLSDNDKVEFLYFMGGGSGLI